MIKSSVIDNERRTVELMIRLYCRSKEGNSQLCGKCKELLEYADSRLSKCHFGENKPTCRRCPVHCYRPEMRRHMQDVMRYAGPRMFFYHPIIAIRHIFRELRK